MDVLFKIKAQLLNFNQKYVDFNLNPILLLQTFLPSTMQVSGMAWIYKGYNLCQT